jgi:uncharacterized membrane protein YhaH (DUF805 family)
VMDAKASKYPFEGRVSCDVYQREIYAIRLGATFIGALAVFGGGSLVLWLNLSPVVIALVVVAYLFLMAFVLRASLSFSVRRMHDLGFSGWWSALDYAISLAVAPLWLAGLFWRVPTCLFIGFALALFPAALSYFRLMTQGQAWSNRYGDPPSAPVEPQPVTFTSPRDMDAELRAARAELDQAKTEIGHPASAKRPVAKGDANADT